MRLSDWLRACQTQFRRHLTIAVLSSAVNVLHNIVKERTQDFQLFRSHRDRTMVEPLHPNDSLQNHMFRCQRETRLYGASELTINDLPINVPHCKSLPAGVFIGRTESRVAHRRKGRN